MSKTPTIRHYKKAARLACVRAERFWEGLCVRTELINVLKQFFSDKEKIEITGLKYVYDDLKEYVNKNNFIGYIINGDTFKNHQNFEIGKYTTVQGITISLKCRDICQILLEDYYTEYELIEACKRTPNFNIYIKACVNGVVD